VRLAGRTAKIESSGIRKVFDLASKLENPINLSIGQPDFDVPEPVKNAAISAIRAGQNKYTLTQGVPELREKVRAHISRTRGWEPQEVMITSGVSGAILLSLLVTVEEGDEVIIPDPYFVMYKHLVNLCGGTPVFVDTYPDFKLTPDKLEAAITPRTKLAFLNWPNNPTGAVMARDEIDGVVETLRKHGVPALSDEIYDSFVFDGEFASVASAYPEGTLLLGGFSKTWAMTGWRLGFAAGAADVLSEMIKIQQFSFVNAPSMVQQAGLAALDYRTDEFRREYRRKRDLVYHGLKDDFEVEKPRGAFYIFPKAPGGSATDFVTRAIENNVLVIPGSVFGEKDTHFRISYAADDQTIRRGVETLCRLARG